MPSTDLVRPAERALAPAQRTARMYLEHPGADPSSQWRKGTALASRASSAAVAGASDRWALAFDGDSLPGWLPGRLGRAASTLVKRDGLDAELVVRCAMGLPDLARAYRDAWVRRFRDTPPQAKFSAAIFEAFALGAEGKRWRLIQESLATCAMRGNAFVTNTYIELLGREAGPAPAAAAAPDSFTGRAQRVHAALAAEQMGAQR